MAFDDLFQRVRFRTVCHVGYSLLVLVIAISLTSMQLVQIYHETKILHSTMIVRQLSMTFAEFRIVESRRQSSLLEYLMVGSEHKREEFRADQQRIIELSLELVHLAGTFDDQDIREQLAKINHINALWNDTFATVAIENRSQGQPTFLSDALTARNAELTEQMDKAIVDLDAAIVNRLEAYIDEQGDSSQRGQFWLAVIILGVLAFGGILVWLVTNEIEKPLVELDQFATQVVHGSTPPPPAPRGIFELHQLTENFSAMVRTLREREKQLLRSQVDTARSNQDLLLLTEFARYLQQVRSEDEIGSALIKQIRRVTNASQIGLYLRHRNNPAFELIAAYPPLGSDELKLHRLISPEGCSVAHSHKRILVLDSYQELSASCQAGCTDFRSELCLPLSARGEVVGLLHLASEAAVGWSHEAVELVTSLANFTAPTVSNLRSLENMWERATRDPLTTLYNRRYLEEYLPVALESARRQREPLAVLMCDIDHFKSINDSQGHDAGDRILRLLGQTIRECVRASDVVCRYGGEEFTVVLPKTDDGGAMVIAEKIRQRVPERCHRGPDPHASEPVTVSIGIAVYPDHGAEPGELIKAADLALYRAKAQGRNCSVLFQSTGTAVAAVTSSKP